MVATGVGLGPQKVDFVLTLVGTTECCHATGVV